MEGTNTDNNMTVYDLFTIALHVRPDDVTLAELSVDTECGGACRKAIWAARAFMESADDAVHGDIIKAANRAVEIYWRG